MQLQDKVAVVYGAAGSIGSVVARRFAVEGANVYLTGLHGPPRGAGSARLELQRMPRVCPG